MDIINYTKLNIENLIEFCADKLNVSAKLIVMYNDNLLDKFSSADIEIEALLYKSVLDHTYSLILRKGLKPDLIICHEMIHLQQYETGDLDLDMRTKTFYWKGKAYRDIPYMDRPWEIETFRKDRKLLKAYKLSAKQKPL